VRAKGVEYVPFAVLLAGVLQLAAGKARVGKYIRIVPHPVCLHVIYIRNVQLFYGQMQIRIRGATSKICALGVCCSHSAPR
jgi:SulP family sulfate permease